jgi:hypothetical protein
MLSLKENLLRALYHADPAWVPYDGEGSWQFVDMDGREPPVSGRDEWGVTWAPLPETYAAGADEPLHSYPAAPAAADIRALPDHPFPDAGNPVAYANLLAGVDTSVTLAVGRHPAGLLDRFVALLGFEQAFACLVSEPEQVAAVMQRLADYHIQVAHGYLAAGAEAGFLADDYAGQGGPFLSPRQWRPLILPGLARIIAVYRAAGAPVIFHTCGRAEEFLPDLIDAGVTAFNLESGVCDLPALKARYGSRIAFFGGLSVAVMQTGGPDDVRRATLKAIHDLSAGGGLVLASDQPLAFSEANVTAFVDTTRRYGGYLANNACEA